MKVENSSNFFLGTVTEVSENGVKIQLDGHSEALEKNYKQLNTGSLLSVDDRVVIMKLNGSYIVMGKISYDSEASDKVSKSGDTMTGELNMKSTTDTIGTRPSASHSDRRVYFRDLASTIFGKLQSLFMADGRIGMQLGTQRHINGNLTENNVSLYIDESGNRTVALTVPGEWRKALGLGSSTGEFPLTIAQGGTGSTEVSQTTTISQIATAGSNITINSAYYYQWGKLAMFEIIATATAAISSGSTIFTIVAGKCPVIESSAQVWLSTSHSAIIRQNGEVVLGGTLSSGSGVTVLACYLLA